MPLRLWLTNYRSNGDSHESGSFQYQPASRRRRRLIRTRPALSSAGRLTRNGSMAQFWLNGTTSQMVSTRRRCGSSRGNRWCVRDIDKPIAYPDWVYVSRTSTVRRQRRLFSRPLVNSRKSHEGAILCRCDERGQLRNSKSLKIGRPSPSMTRQAGAGSY
jgi:hypothetical protein